MSDVISNETEMLRWKMAENVHEKSETSEPNAVCSTYTVAVVNWRKHITEPAAEN